MKKSVAYAAAVLLPFLICWPIVQAFSQWRTWEQASWLICVAAGVWGWFVVSDAEKRR